MKTFLIFPVKRIIFLLTGRKMTRFFPLFRAKFFTGKLGSQEISNLIPPWWIAWWVGGPVVVESGNKANSAQLSCSLSLAKI